MTVQLIWKLIKMNMYILFNWELTKTSTINCFTQSIDMVIYLKDTKMNH